MLDHNKCCVRRPQKWDPEPQIGPPVNLELLLNGRGGFNLDFLDYISWHLRDDALAIENHSKKKNVSIS